MSAGIGATAIVREVVGVGVEVVRSWVDTGVDVSVEGAGVGVTDAVMAPGLLWGIGVGVIFAGDGGKELDSAVATTDVGIAAGIGA